MLKELARFAGMVATVAAISALAFGVAPAKAEGTAVSKIEKAIVYYEGVDRAAYFMGLVNVVPMYCPDLRLNKEMRAKIGDFSAVAMQSAAMTSIVMEASMDIGSTVIYDASQCKAIAARFPAIFETK